MAYLLIVDTALAEVATHQWRGQTLPIWWIEDEFGTV